MNRVITAVVTFALASALIVVLPGPDTMVVMRGILLRGRRGAVRTVAGVLTGLVVWVTAAVIGLSALLRASHAGYTALRLVGAVYLVTLGVRALLSRYLPDMSDPQARPVDGPGGPEGPKEPEEPAASSGSARGGVLGTGYFAGLTTDLLNPKVGVFFVTFLPGFVPHGAPVGPTSALLGAIFLIETLAYFAILLLLVDRIASLMSSPTARRRLDRMTGVILVTFGLRLATEG
ncbi:MAG: LysE family translocator [Frankia sp.]